MNRTKKWALPLAVTLILVCAGCTFSGINLTPGLAGSGRLVDKEYAFADFSRVEAGYGARVTVTQGEAYGITLTVDDNLVDYLVVEKRGDTLHIGLKAGGYRNITLRASVTLPALRGLGLSGGSQGTMSGFSSSESLALEASGGSNLNGDIEAGDTTVNASGGSRITLRGAGKELRLEGSGGSPIDMGSYTSTNARVNLSGGTRATVNVNGTLDADLSGGSRLNYVGSPTLGRVNSSGGSQINRQ